MSEGAVVPPRPSPSAPWQRSMRRVRRRLGRLPVVHWTWSERTLLIYRIAAAEVPAAADDDGFACNRLADLECFEQTERWLRRDAFIAEAHRRIADGMRLYTHVRGDVLLHWAWLVPRQEEASFPYVGQRYRFQAGTAVLFNAYTHPRARGQGLHERSMRRRLADAAAHPGTAWIVSAFESTNRVSRGVAERVGMRPQVALFERVRFGRSERGVQELAALAPGERPEG